MTSTNFSLYVSLSLVIPLLVTTILLYQRRTFRLRKNFEQLRIRHAQELEIVRQEIYRRSLEQVSAEIHDNLGQQLSLIKLNLSAAVMQPSTANREWLVKLLDMTSQLMRDMRYLAKNMYFDSLESVELPEAIQSELDRINRTGELSAQLLTNGIPAKLDQKVTIILLRMFQENMNNVLSHSKAKNCQVTLDYTKDQFKLQITDDGEAREPENKIANRSALIGAKMTANSEPGKGTTITICLPFLSTNSQE